MGLDMCDRTDLRFPLLHLLQTPGTRSYDSNQHLEVQLRSPLILGRCAYSYELVSILCVLGSSR